MKIASCSFSVTTVKYMFFFVSGQINTYSKEMHVASFPLKCMSLTQKVLGYFKDGKPWYIYLLLVRAKLCLKLGIISWYSEMFQVMLNMLNKAKNIK